MLLSRRQSTKIELQEKQNTFYFTFKNEFQIGIFLSTCIRNSDEMFLYLQPRGKAVPCLQLVSVRIMSE